jgi:hypothetical protein
MRGAAEAHETEVVMICYGIASTSVTMESSNVPLRSLSNCPQRVEQCSPYRFTKVVHITLSDNIRANFGAGQDG